MTLDLRPARSSRGRLPLVPGGPCAGRLVLSVPGQSLAGRSRSTPQVRCPLRWSSPRIAIPAGSGEPGVARAPSRHSSPLRAGCFVPWCEPDRRNWRMWPPALTTQRRGHGRESQRRKSVSPRDFCRIRVGRGVNRRATVIRVRAEGVVAWGVADRKRAGRVGRVVRIAAFDSAGLCAVLDGWDP